MSAFVILRKLSMNCSAGLFDGKGYAISCGIEQGEKINFFERLR